MTQSRRCAVILALLSIGCGGHKPSAPENPAGRVSSPAPRGPWTLVFADEFDIDGAPDSTKWGYEIGAIRNKELQYYTARNENVRAEQGMLLIEARREAYQGHGYTSASINTKGRFEFQYGRVEVRAKLPTGLGTWPAIWMLGTNISQVGWPACGEIDVMENVGFDPLTIHGTVHTAAYNHSIGTARGGKLEVDKPWEAFHVYAVEWFADRIDFYVDEQLYFSFSNEGTGSRAWPFDAKQYLLLNLAIGGAWGGQKGVDDTLFPHRYLIDYVRVYKQG